MDHEHYQERIDFVKSILQLNNLEAASIEPVEYDINGPPFSYNNFIYLVTLSSPTTTSIKIKSSQSSKLKAGTVPIPADTTSLIFRLANPNPLTGLNNTNRVENEIAFMTLVRQALAKSKYSHIVPEVYAWASTSSGQGFSIQQYMRGTMPDRGFENLSLQDKSVVLGQMAEILALLQQIKIPKTLEKFGGLKFDQYGEVVSAQMTVYKGEPCTTYKDLLRAIFRVKLQEADENPVIQGGKENGNVQRVLVHSDLTTNNLLYDATTLQVTALLDFDFSFIGTVADEFMSFSFANLSGGKLPGPYESVSKLKLRNAMLTGFSESVLNADCSEVQWDVAKTWDEELARAGTARPRTISHFHEIADIYWLQDRLSPFELDSPFMRIRKTAEQLKTVRDETESLIVRFLESTSATL
ncbi:hypothetical protein ED733_001605 [Metarhizium rileyi]|uniref:Aminoglycoside phosphotransferase domain-containing protein n=1 Tax=Metarhizium rileyi (strain RCEF 4871) TaxID=1649241 RepID=A0A5C6G4Q6_METRR|nr:hypothetical protein ED733_001605 [Metarhizium rileyi]